MNINITKITIVKGRGTDKLYFDTDLPPQYVCQPQSKGSFMMDTTADTGEAYCEANFSGIPVEVIDVTETRPY